jgi:hypothetical protein
MNTAVERFNTNNPNLCPHLRWKGLFIGVEHDPTVPSMSSGNFWCVYTHNCLGPDRELAEPGECSSADRACYGKGSVE